MPLTSTGPRPIALRFRNIDTGEDRPDLIDGVYYGSAWGADNRTFFFVRPDEMMRPWQVWRHLLGTESAEDRLVFQEDDERFFVDVDLSRSQKRIVIHSSSKTTSEARWIDAGAPDSEPTVILARQLGVEYEAEHDGEGWLIRSNHPGPDGAAATNFALYRLAEESADPLTLRNGTRPPERRQDRVGRRLRGLPRDRRAIRSRRPRATPDHRDGWNRPCDRTARARSQPGRRDPTLNGIHPASPVRVHVAGDSPAARSNTQFHPASARRSGPR